MSSLQKELHRGGANVLNLYTVGRIFNGLNQVRGCKFGKWNGIEGWLTICDSFNSSPGLLT